MTPTHASFVDLPAVYVHVQYTYAGRYSKPTTRLMAQVTPSSQQLTVSIEEMTISDVTMWLQREGFSEPVLSAFEGLLLMECNEGRGGISYTCR